jgi:hypothetical protein
MSALGSVGTVTLNGTNSWQNFPKLDLRLSSGSPSTFAVTVTTNANNAAPVSVGTSPGGSANVLQPINTNSQPVANNTTVFRGLSNLDDLWAWGVAGDTISWGVG